MGVNVDSSGKLCGDADFAAPEPADKDWWFVMGIFSAAEIMENYTELGKKKAESPWWKLFFLGIVAGLLIGFGGVVSNTAGHALDNASVARIAGGLLFPFGLGIVMLTGAELFTGNCMICTSVLAKKATVAGLLKNWLFVYLGNLIGSLLLALGCAVSGQFALSGGALAVYTIKVAVNKCSLEFGPAVILGFFCNVLVCLGVLCSLSAKDTAGRILGAYIPVAFFVISGFEHSIANMYYIAAGLFAMTNPAYAALAVEAGLETANLTWGNFFTANLLPVTIGNIIGGAGVAVLLWFCHRNKKGNNA